MTDKTTTITTHKNWWAPLWTGLVIDQEAKHLKKMRMAIWLWLYLLLTADRQTGCLRRKIKTISHEIGMPERTIQRWLRRLKNHGHIATKTTGHCLTIQITKWKGVTDLSHPSPQRGQVWQTRSVTSDTPEKGLNSRNPQHLRHKSAISADANDNDIKEILTNDNIASKLKTFKEWQPRTREELLAWDLAEALHDTQGFPFYLACAKRYPEDLLRRIASEIKLRPSHKIKKGRGALFNHILNQYGHDTPHHHRH
jgi:hypothetical protein